MFRKIRMNSTRIVHSWVMEDNRFEQVHNYSLSLSSELPISHEYSETRV